MCVKTCPYFTAPSYSASRKSKNYVIKKGNLGWRKQKRQALFKGCLPLCRLPWNFIWLISHPPSNRQSAQIYNSRNSFGLLAKYIIFALLNNLQ